MCVYDIFLIGVSSSSRMTVLDCKRSIIRKGSIFIPSQELCTKNGMPTEQFSTLQYSPIWRKRQITWIICVCFLHIDVHWNRNWVILLATVQIKLFYVWLLNFYWIEKFMNSYKKVDRNGEYWDMTVQLIKFLLILVVRWMDFATFGMSPNSLWGRKIREHLKLAMDRVCSRNNLKSSSMERQRVLKCVFQNYMCNV